MTAKLTKLSHKITTQLHLVAESCTVCSCRSRWPVQELLYTPSYCSKSLYYIFCFRTCMHNRF